MRDLLAELREEWRSLDSRIAASDREFLVQARSTEACRRLTTIPGIGPSNAVALVAPVGDTATFRRGRDLAAWLGLVRRQVTTGGVPRVVGITKRGREYLRKMLIQGARAAMPVVAKLETPLGAWLRALLARAHPNKVVVGFAARFARIVWALLHRAKLRAPAGLSAQRINSLPAEPASSV